MRATHYQRKDANEELFSVQPEDQPELQFAKIHLMLFESNGTFAKVEDVNLLKQRYKTIIFR